MAKYQPKNVPMPNLPKTLDYHGLELIIANYPTVDLVIKGSYRPMRSLSCNSVVPKRLCISHTTKKNIHERTSILVNVEIMHSPGSDETLGPRGKCESTGRCRPKIQKPSEFHD